MTPSCDLVMCQVGPDQNLNGSAPRELSLVIQATGFFPLEFVLNHDAAQQVGPDFQKRLGSFKSDIQNHRTS